MTEIKYIIVRDSKGFLRHFKDGHLHHRQIAEHNGYIGANCIIEAGLLLEGQLYILESQNSDHLKKRADKYIGNNLNLRNDLRLSNWLRGRELESQLYYSKEPILREGD